MRDYQLTMDKVRKYAAAAMQADAKTSQCPREDDVGTALTLFDWRRGSGSNRRIRVLQTLALPLGYRAAEDYT
jgi:hypothetical protein